MRYVLVRSVLAVAFAFAVSAYATEYSGWQWQRVEGPAWLSPGSDQGKYLTENQGAHAVAVHEYDNGLHRLLVTATLEDTAKYRVRVYEYEDFWDVEGQEVIPVNDGENSGTGAACIDAGPISKYVAAVQASGNKRCWCASRDLDVGQNGWPLSYLTVPDNTTTVPDIAIVSYYPWLFVVHRDEDENALYCSRSSDDGETWTETREVAPGGFVPSGESPYEPSLDAGACPCVAWYDAVDDDIWFRKSKYGDGYQWDSPYNKNLTDGNYSGRHPCLATSDAAVIVVWQDAASGDVVYRLNFGSETWYPDPDYAPAPIPGWQAVPGYREYDQVNVAMIQGGVWGTQPFRHVLLTARVHCTLPGYPDLTYVVCRRGILTNAMTWFPEVGLTPVIKAEDDLNYRPSICGVSDSYDTLAACVWSDDYLSTTGARQVFLARARWARWHDWQDPPGQADNISRRLDLTLDGTPMYAAGRSPYVISGPVWGPSIIPIFVDCGFQPALAVDGDTARWLAYVRDDTVWCKLGENGYKAVFAGSSSAVPGQPSIVCYPNRADGVYVGNVVFPVYDTTGGTSKIMYARVDTSTVVLDTIESVANLGDSLPCINVYLGDSLVVTWQHGDSTLASMLRDYGPGTSGQVPAWSSPSLVSANGYHPMSAFDEGGSALNVVWTRNNGSNYAIQRATCDLATSVFGNWSQMATPGDTGAYEKSNPVFAGLGVSCYQQKGANGKWNIIGFVRGDTVTLVANDTDAYHPHAVAESSAISPSIDQVRVHLLYTAGVAFEVDSGVYDTGETRYVCESLNVSRATSDATKSNNGAKLLRKNGLDSLFSVYSDLDNAVVFAWSANGDTWQRSVIATGRDYPAIAEDSSGKRWVVMRKLSQSINPPIQEAYYRNGSSWTGPETLYSVSGTTLGSASLSGSSDTTSGIAYAAFLSTATGGTQSLILAKFNGSVVSTYTVATGTTLGDPALTVEPYLADSDHIHVTWEDNGTIKYVMDTDGRSTSIASNWTSTVELSSRGIVSQHPSINADRDQIVVAWAQGTTTDIYSRKRSTSSAYNNWDAAVNLSNTASNASDWPTIAMGDTVVVAWEETRSGNDHDILACIDFDDTLNVADNATLSGYPHVLFQNKASGDTAIPYLHTIFSETPDVSYFEVRYNKLNLKHPTGEGQQSANTPPIPVKPSLASCSPNPFRNHTRISYALPTAGNVSLRVYDVTGRTVRTLASGHQRAGNYSVNWDARDSHGKQVPYGVYFYRLDTPGFRSVKKAVVAR